jgi:hypothetical protein
MDIGDVFDAPLVNGIPLVTGTDLFGQFRYLGIGGGLPMIVMTIAVGRSPDEIPTYENLGIDRHVYLRRWKNHGWCGSSGVLTTPNGSTRMKPRTRAGLVTGAYAHGVPGLYRRAPA